MTHHMAGFQFLKFKLVELIHFYFTFITASVNDNELICHHIEINIVHLLSHLNCKT